MMTGIATTNGIYITCPHCDETFENPESGSELIDAGEHERLPNTINCQYCGETYRKPAYPSQRRIKRAA